MNVKNTKKEGLEIKYSKHPISAGILSTISEFPNNDENINTKNEWSKWLLGVKKKPLITNRYVYASSYVIERVYARIIIYIKKIIKKEIVIDSNNIS